MARSIQPQPLPPETLSALWFKLHSEERFGVRASEAHYLRTLAVSLDDDLTSLLLLKKLKLANEYLPSQLPSDIVAFNSVVEFRTGRGPTRIGQLIYPSSCRPKLAIDVNSRLGLGLLGLCSGQAILWPDEDEILRELEVLRVDASSCRNRRRDLRSMQS